LPYCFLPLATDADRPKERVAKSTSISTLATSMTLLKYDVFELALASQCRVVLPCTTSSCLHCGLLGDKYGCFGYLQAVRRWLEFGLLGRNSDSRRFVHCLHDARDNLPLTGYLPLYPAILFPLQSPSNKRDPITDSVARPCPADNFFWFLVKHSLFHWALRTVGPEQFRAFKNRRRNLRRCSRISCTSAVSSP
jgi:hypothetical protein